MLNKPNALANLRDIHLPAKISFWPLAPGWYLFAFLCILLLMGFAYYCFREWRKRLVKRAALEELSQLEKKLSTLSPQQLTKELSVLLRRVALAYYKRDDIAGLYGKEWIAFLAYHSREPNFEESAKILATAPYQKNVSCDAHSLIELCRKWVKQLKVTKEYIKKYV